MYIARDKYLNQEYRDPDHLSALSGALPQGWKKKKHTKKMPCLAGCRIFFTGTKIGLRSPLLPVSGE